jgi:predicted O-linked N-acetylglucosamine transferase (SPINDLY family)/MoaA/NifB/PqqE/SkfB family radical SAM enzyme
MHPFFTLRCQRADMSEKLFAAPARLRRFQIEITTGCNLHCAGCQRTLGMADGTWRNLQMPFSRFTAILAHAPLADAIILQGIGEPTLHPHLARFITAARQDGKFGLVSFNTNALLRDTDYYADLRWIGLGHISISVDSLVPQTVDALRAGTDCALLRARIERLIDLFEGSVTLSVVLSRRNLPELPTLLSQLHELGARVVEVQPLVSYAASIDPLALDAPELMAARDTIQRVQQLLPTLSVLPAAALMPNGTRCRRPFRAAYVTVEGYLTPCCLTNDVDLLGRVSLEHTPFAELWGTAQVQRFLEDYFDHEPSICIGCAFNPRGTASDAPRLQAATAPIDIATAKSLHQQGKLAAAEAAFQSLSRGPDGAEALQGLGLLRFQAGDLHAALSLLMEADTSASSPRCGHNLAIVLNALGRSAEAIARQRRNLAAFPDYVPTYLALAEWLAAAGARTDAGSVLIAFIERAVRSEPPPSLETVVQRLAAECPEHPDLLRAANLLRIGGRQELTIDLLQARLARQPNDLGARLTLAMARLAVVHRSQQDIAGRRAAYTEDLSALSALTEVAEDQARAQGAAQVGTAKPFYLAYQGQDDRDLQLMYGAIVSRLMASTRPVPKFAPPSTGRFRVGFATAYFHLHSVSKLFGGWITELDRQRFEIFGYHLGEGEDATSMALAAGCAHFRRGPRNDDAWAQAIAEDGLHALIYPEIGMHPAAVRLAARRLAPLQCVAWGHPVTTGLPELDVFLSSALMEPPDGADHYTERLVTLPNLSICYTPMAAGKGGVSRAGLGFSERDIVYLCCQSLFKYHPHDDRLLADIAAQVPGARFVFIGDINQNSGAACLRDRLCAAFATARLDAQHHLRFVRPVAADDFPSLLSSCDVYLDSLGWSGGNTTLEALCCDLPVVTMPGRFMRGRHSTAILRMMGMEAWIATTPVEYVAKAVALADPKTRGGARLDIQRNKHRLFRDLTPIRALETFLAQEIPVSGKMRSFATA